MEDVRTTAADLDDAQAAAERYRAPALDKGLDILEVLAAHARGLTRAEIVKEMGLSPSQIYRMLERLVARGYVARTEGGDRYELSMKLFLLGAQHPPLRRLVSIAQPLLDAFSRETRQSVHLVLPDHGIGVVVAQASPMDHFEFRARVGGRMDLFTSGSGQVLLAFQNPDSLPETVGRWGITPDDARLARMLPQLAAVRAQGNRRAPSGHIEGVIDLSVPVLGCDGQAMAALTCAFVRHPGDTDAPDIDAALARLQALARAIPT